RDASRKDVQFQIATRVGDGQKWKEIRQTRWLSADRMTESGPQRFELCDVAAGATVRCVPQKRSDAATNVLLEYSRGKAASKDQALLVTLKFRGTGQADLWVDHGVQH